MELTHGLGATPLPAPAPVAVQGRVVARRPRRLSWDALLIAVSGLILVTTWRIQDLFPILTSIQAPTLAAAAAYCLYLINVKGVRAPKSVRHPVTTVAVVIFCLMIASVPWGVWPGYSFNFIFKDHIKTLVMMLLVAASIRATLDVERYLMIHVAGALMYSLLVITTLHVGEGGRLGDLWYYDANDLGMLLAAAIPMMVYLARPGAKLVQRIVAGGGLGIAAMTIVKTGSRGGFIATMAMGAFMLFGFNAIPKRIRIGAVATLAALVVLLGSDQYWAMMGTLLHPTQDYNWSGKSEAGRMEIWKRGMGYMLDNPVVGVGANAFPMAEGMLSPLAARQQLGIGLKWSAAHNSFVQIGAELGVGGLLCFLLLLYQAFRSLARVRRAARDDPQRTREASLADALTGTLVAYCVGGFFLSQAYSPLLYAVLGMVVGLAKVGIAPPAASGIVARRVRG